MRYKPQTTVLNGLPQKWCTLMEYIHNSIPPVHKCIFADSQAAKIAYSKMYSVCQRSTYMNMELIKRDNVVYVIKSVSVQELTIKDQ